MRVKICGLTNAEDAQYAVQCGADALGFVFYQKSPRYIDPESVKRIISELPPFVTTVGLFVNESLDRIAQIVNDCRLDRVQLHGEELPADCDQLPFRVIKAIRIGQNFSVQNLTAYSVSAFLLDAYVPGQPGGTGQRCDWGVASKVARKYTTILAGGLDPENIVQAIQQVAPYGVDVSSGVENEPGKKSQQKISQFIRLAKGAI
ncbi:MAG: phosphoribosylanthranilate isomerase [Deltaproteobacteria bacterium]|jgi:phosphoribosylanthranilate isomerase|nr:phosphoribosylanthranilate isomerase [Deltaproteobacteria bacterium]